MKEQATPALAAWKLPLIVGAIAVSIVAGFYAGGPGAGMAVGALAAGAIVVMAVRNPPRARIVPVPASDSRRRVLLVLGSALDDHGAEELAGIVEDEAGERAELLLISPCRSSFLERWTSDLEPGRLRAQRNLVHSSSVLAKAGIAASARVGDEDIVQMTEDELGSFAATEVVLVEQERARGGPAAELRARLAVPLGLVLVSAAQATPAIAEAAPPVLR